MMGKKRRQTYKSKAHETFLAKHAYTSKGPNPSIEMVIKAIREEKGLSVPREAQWASNSLIYQ